MNATGKLLRTSLAVLLTALAAGEAMGQHSFFNASLPAGEIGRTQVARRPDLAGVAQPVLLRVPDGATVAVAEGAGFGAINQDAALVSLTVGETYRLKVSNIPFEYGDVYPTVELIDRMHAPPGKETRYPIPVELTTEELKMALSGKFVVRVIYVEDPRRALGVQEPPEQRYFEVMAHEDPFKVAVNLGRPVAILRMGSVAPNPTTGPTSQFLFGSPPVQHHVLQPRVPAYVPRELKPEDLPAQAREQATQPSAPDQLDGVAEETPIVPQDLPEKKIVEEQPGQIGEDDPSPVDNLDVNDDPFGDENPFGDGASDALEDDPFGDEI